MSKRTISILLITHIILGLVSAGLIVAGVTGSLWANQNAFVTTGHITSLSNLPLFIIGVIIASLSGIAYLIALIGALVNLARLQQWVWFVLLLFLHTIGVLIYLIGGPTTPAGVLQQSPYMPRSDQPSQNYPQS